MSVTAFCAGFVDITPTTPLPLAGYAHRHKRFTRVANPLELNVIIVFGKRTKFIIISADLLYIGDSLRRKLIEKLNGYVSEDQLFLCASHTHFAPATDPRLPRLGKVDSHYLDFVAKKAVSLIKRILSEGETEGSLTYKQGRFDRVSNRRKNIWTSTGRVFPPLVRRWDLHPNEHGPRDERVHLIAAYSSDQHRPKAIVWSYACHPVCFPDRSAVSADFVGVVRRQLRNEFGEQVPVVFLQGFAGNIKPQCLLTPWGIKERLAALINGPRFGTPDHDFWAAWSRALADQVVHTATSRGEQALEVSESPKRSEIPLSRFVSGADSNRRLTLQKINFGDSVSLVGASAELMAEHSQMLRQLCPCRIVIPVGYIDEVFGYLPTAAMVSQGGYESEGFQEHFGFQGSFRPNLDQVLRSEFNSFLK